MCFCSIYIFGFFILLGTVHPHLFLYNLFLLTVMVMNCHKKKSYVSFIKESIVISDIAAFITGIISSEIYG